MMAGGWIKLHRKIFNNPIVTKDPDHFTVWCYLLLMAAHEDYPTMYGGKKIILKPGQLVTGRKKISEDTGVQESKVKRIINLFKSDQQIDQHTKPYGSVITILNWHEYQQSDQQTDQRVTNNRPTNDRRVTTIQEGKEGKEDKEKRVSFKPPSIEEVTEYCRQRNNGVDPQRWYDFYQSKNWMIGKNKMKDWKAAVRTWENREKRTSNRADDWMERWSK